MAVGWRKGRGHQFGPADGVPTGEDTPRCFSRRGLRAKHGGRSGFASEGTVAACLLLSCAGDPGGDGERRLSARSRLGCVSHKGFSPLGFIIEFICVELRQGGVQMHLRVSHPRRGQISPRGPCLFYRLPPRCRGSELKFTLISPLQPKRPYLIYTSGIRMAVRGRSKILPVIRVEMKDLVYIQVILNGRALKPHPALLCISISWCFCAAE